MSTRGSHLRGILRSVHRRAADRLPGRLGAVAPVHPGDYVHLATPVLLGSGLFQLSAADLADSAQTRLQAGPAAIETATWFVPYFRHLEFGGIHTIFRFISGFTERGLRCRIVIYDNRHADVSQLKSAIAAAFPNLSAAELVIFDVERDSVGDLPATDVGICTFWASAYLLLKFNRVGRKFYFIQDYEPLFYSAGSVYALAESTYRFGFTGLVNTPGLLSAIETQHGLTGASFVPAVDPRYYHPGARAQRGAKVRIFFYARPNHPRNAFELGLLIIRRLIDKYAGAIEIVVAGADWDERRHGLGGQVTNVGLLGSLEAVGALYRTCDIGFVYMLSKHPSYQPFEFMACGMATVTNRNESNSWFLRDGVNCLIAEPSPGAMAEQIGRLIDDPQLRAAIGKGGLASVSSDWDAQVESMWNVLRS